MNILDMVVDGVRVGDTDLTKLRTIIAVNRWVKRVARIWRDQNPNGDYLDARDAMVDFIVPYRNNLYAEIEARKTSMPARNLDLVVKVENDNRDPSMNYDMADKTVREVGTLLDCFDRAEQMTAYEFDAYATLGDDECEAQVIETLYDMFGTEWAEAFYKRKNSLIARSELERLYADRQALSRQIEKYEAML